MTELGFPSHFVQLVMTCLSINQYSILINGVPSPLIHPKRGMRHGDPLSPPPLHLMYGVILYNASHPPFKLSSIPFQVQNNGSALNHLCFADDLLLFCNDDTTSMQIVLEGLKFYSDTTGLQVNK